MAIFYMVESVVLIGVIYVNFGRLDGVGELIGLLSQSSDGFERPVDQCVESKPCEVRSTSNRLPFVVE
jgi:hypothetical protein